jgi:hypothetical protein
MRRARGLVSLLLAGWLWLLVLVASAFASAPEAPETQAASELAATSAKLNGVLNPGKPGGPGSYQFSFAASEAGECVPGTLLPEAPAFAAGAEREAVSQTLTGLEPNRRYAFCVIAYDLAAQPAQGAAVSFRTLALPPEVAVGSERTSGVGATGATLEAQLNPNNESSDYAFEYSTSESGGSLTGTVVKVNGSEPVNGFSPEGETVAVPTEALKPGTTYFYRVVAENAQSKTEGKPVAGMVASFTTVPAPQTEAATAVTATAATLHGTLTPLNELVPTEFSFDYGPHGCTAEGGGVFGPESVGTGSGAKQVSAAVENLQPDQTYAVCLVSINAFGFQFDPASPEVTFTTLPAPPGVDGESISGVTPFEATLEAQINPNNQSTSYFFEYARTEAALGTPAAATLPGQFALPARFGDQSASAAIHHQLTPGTPYFYRVVAENAAHEKTLGNVEEFKTNPLEPPVVESESTNLPPFEVSSVTANTAALTARVNTNYLPSTYIFQYSTSEAELLEGKGVTVPGGELPAGLEHTAFGGEQTPLAVVYLPRTLAAETTYFYRVVARNETGVTDGPSAQFTTLAAPVLTTAPAQHVSRTVATLSGTVNPLGVETHYHYAYVHQQGYEEELRLGAEDPYAQGTSTPEVAIGSESTPEPTEPVEVTGLSPGTTYDYAVVATNSLGVTVVGPNQMFTTAPTLPPLLGATSVSNITQTTATITGSLDAHGEPTRWELRLGTSPGDLPYRAAGHGEGSEAEPVVAGLEHLAPGVAYYYRLVATNPGDQEHPAQTPEASFTTAAATASAPAAGTPPITLPNITLPGEEAAPPPPSTHRPLTNAQKLAKALKVCHAKHGRKRAACEAAAHRRFPTSKKRKRK